MSSPWKERAPEIVADRVLKRVEVSKIARKLQNRLALAQFKTSRGWEDFTLDKIELKVDEELKGRRRPRPRSREDVFSDSSSSTSEFPYTVSRTLMSSPLKANIFSDQTGSRIDRGSRRKRTYHSSFESSSLTSSSQKIHRSASASRDPLSSQASHSSWKNNYQLTQSSPIKPRKPPNFTTSSGPNLSFYQRSSDTILEDNHTTNYAAVSDDENELPAHSFHIRSASPLETPMARNRSTVGQQVKEKDGKSGEEGADLLLFLATSPSTNPSARARIQAPSTPPPKNKDATLPSSIMTTPGGEGFLSVFGGPNTPSQGFDFTDFVNITPSPGQRAWSKTPRTIKTPLTVNRRNLHFEPFIGSSPSPSLQDHNLSTTKHAGLGMQLGGDLL